MAGKKTRDELIDILNLVVDKVTSNLNIDEILLYGSYAKGKENDDSDIDIAVISPDLEKKNPIFENALYVHRKASLYEPYIQLVAFPSRTYYEEEFIKPEFIQENKNTGKLIYKKNFEIDILKAFS